MSRAIVRPVGQAKGGGDLGVGESSWRPWPSSSAAEGCHRIVAVNRFYWPDEAPTGQLLTDLAEHLARSGQAITVITSGLRYRNARATLPHREQRNGVDIVRVWSSGFGGHHLLGRLIEYLTFYLAATLQVARNLGPGDILLVKTDPPLMVVGASLIARLKGARLVHWCQDLFPEVAVALGMKVAMGPIGGALRWPRNLAFRSADMNVAISDRMCDRLIDIGVARERIQIIANWPGCEIKPLKANRNPLRLAWGLDHRFVIGYSGNLGRAHIPETVFQLVSQLNDRPDLRFLFVGDGVGMRWLRAQCEEANHRHVMFEPYQPKERLGLSLSVPDLHLVSLHPACEGLMMPSKLYGILAAARPVLFLGDERGGVADFLGKSGAGLALDCNAPETWAAKLAPAFADRSWVEDRGAAARRSFETTYTAEAALTHWCNLLETTVDTGDPVNTGEAA